MAKIAEGHVHAHIERKAESYSKRYRSQMNLLDKSLLAKCRGISHHDIYALGSQLEAFDEYKSFCEENGNLNQLGRIPQIAYDVITVVYGTSILPMLASVQPIEEQRGYVYFKNLKTSEAKGNMTAGGAYMDPTRLLPTPQGYSGNILTTDLGTTSVVNAGSTTTLTGSLTGPLLSQSITVNIGTDAYGQDDGRGHLVGPGINGTVDYETGVISLVLVGPIPSGQAVIATYQQNYEIANDIPAIEIYFDSKSVSAEIFALKGTVGMLENYALKRRFGISAEESLAADLVGEINAEMGGALIRRMYAAQEVTPVDYYIKAPLGVSAWEQQMGLKMKLAKVEANMIDAAGRGIITTMAAGTQACSVFQTLPGFDKVADGNVAGPHIFGNLDGVTIIRVPDSSILPAWEVLPIWKGPTPFEAAAVYAPYMPLIITSTMNNIPNPLRQTRAAATWAALDVIVPRFIGKLNIVDQIDPDYNPVATTSNP